MFGVNAERATYWIGVTCLTALFLGAMNYSSLNMGGSGVQVPYNLFAWLVATLFVLTAIVHIFVVRTLRFHVSTVYYLGAILCLFLPLLWTDRLFLDVEALRIAGTLAGIAFLLAAQQFFGAESRKLLLSILLMSTLIQSFWGLLQYYFIFERSFLFWSAHQSRPYGVFQQVNVYAVYITLGSMLVLHFLADLNKKSTGMICAVAAVLLLNSHLMTLSEASTARAVGFVSVAAYLLYFALCRAFSKSVILLFFGAVCLGTFAPKTMFDVRPSTAKVAPLEVERLVVDTPVSKSVSAVADAGPESRFGTRPTIYAVAVDMIKDEPFFGHGIGSFRKQYLLYQGEYLKKNPAAEAEFNLSHPHNEIFYWVIELGVFTIFGFILVLVAWAVGVKSKFLDLRILLLATPLVLQSMLELPFYHSVAHYLGFMLILVVSMNASGVRSFRIPRWPFAVIGPLVGWSLWKIWIFLLSTYFALTMFLLFNAGGRVDVKPLLKINNPSAFKLRHEFELFQWKFREARKAGEMDLVDINNYLMWAFSTTQYAPMQTTYENFVTSLVLVGKKEAARRYLNEGLLMYPRNEKLRAFDAQLSEMERGSG